MSSPQDLNKLLEQAQQMQSKVAELQRSLAAKTFEGSSGGGMVTASASGALRIVKIDIEPGLLAGDDKEMLQDLIAAACNAALGNAQRSVQEEFQRLSGGMAGFPGFPGGGPQGQG
jgi:DNA-binding YbaB/EbfC family protein